MSTRSQRVIGYSAVIVVGIAAAEAWHYVQARHTVDLVVATIATILAVVIVGTTALLARRSSKSSTPSD